MSETQTPAFYKERIRLLEADRDDLLATHRDNVDTIMVFEQREVQLRAERDAARADIPKLVAALQRERDTIQRLQEALREIAMHDAQPYGKRRQEMGRIARAALADGEETP